MGFLSVNGNLMTYDEYKKHILSYKKRGIMQFAKLFKLHKDRHLKPEQLHWGEEIEYHMYTFDDQNKKVRLSCDADDIIQDFNKLEQGSTNDKPDFKLLPEFWDWMIEAVPTDPYGAYSDPKQLLACADKIIRR